MARRLSKKLKAAQAQFDLNKFYSLIEAIKIAQQTSYAKFDASIDIAINLNLDTRKAEQQLRGAVLLPHGTGKNLRVLVAADDPEQQKAAQQAGADLIMGAIDLEAMLKKGEFVFDVMVAEPKMMLVLGKYGKLLGPKGLMPNPKTGTVTTEIAKAVTELKKGKANYRADKAGIIHSLIGKVSMDAQALADNADTLIQLIKKLKPATVKGTYVKAIHVSATMGPAVKVKLDL